MGALTVLECSLWWYRGGCGSCIMPTKLRSCWPARLCRRRNRSSSNHRWELLLGSRTPATLRGSCASRSYLPRRELPSFAAVMCGPVVTSRDMVRSWCAWMCGATTPSDVATEQCFTANVARVCVARPSRTGEANRFGRSDPE